MWSELAVIFRNEVRYRCAGLTKVGIYIIRFQASEKPLHWIIYPGNFPSDSGFALSDISTITV